MRCSPFGVHPVHVQYVSTGDPLMIATHFSPRACTCPQEHMNCSAFAVIVRLLVVGVVAVAPRRRDFALELREAPLEARAAVIEGRKRVE